MWARPDTVVKIDELENMQYIRIVPNVGMFFPGIDHLRETVNKAASAAEYKVPCVVDCTKFNGLDYTSAQVRTRFKKKTNCTNVQSSKSVLES